MIVQYFAYGSNLWIEQMVRRIGPIGQGADQPRVARLPNYRLVFNVHGEDGQVFANILSPGDGVLGVVYSCSLEAVIKMDAFEKGYERKQVEVVLANGDKLNAFTYFAKTTHVGNVAQPRAEYLKRILDGAKQHSLPEAYMREIETIARGVAVPTAD